LEVNYQYPGNTELVAKHPYSLTKKEKDIEAAAARRIIVNAGAQILDKTPARSERQSEHKSFGAARSEPKSLQQSPRELVKQAFEGSSKKTAHEQFD